jgi:purine-binding chemotaxis protein CheW
VNKINNSINEMEEIDEDTQKGRYLTFSIGKENYGIEIKYITEIIGMQEIAEVPELPEYTKGIINLRGKIIPVIDVRLRFKKEAKVYNDRTCIVVVDIMDISVGLIVDEVSEVITIAEENIVPPPSIKSGFNNRYVRAIGKVGTEVKLLLDCDELLSDEEFTQISNVK